MSTTDLESESPTAQPASMRTSGRRVGDSIFSYSEHRLGGPHLLDPRGGGGLPDHRVDAGDHREPGVLGNGGVSLIETALPLIYGTVLASAIALVIAIPISIGIALFISHFAPRRLASGLGYMIDLLAAVPSVVYGLWGGIWLVPKLEPLYIFLNTYLGWIPLFAGDPTAPMRNLASASVVLAVMVLPIITAVSREVFLQTPRLQEEAALALGATRWETIKTVVLPFGRSGVVAASMLGLGRALGETMAVLMILAPGATFSLHILEVGRHNSIAANIASKQAEASGVDMSLLVFTGLVLFVLTFIINAIARWIVARSGPKS